MIRRSTLRSLLFRVTLGVAAVSVAAPIVGYSTPAEAKRKKKSRRKGKKKAKARAAARKKKAAAMKAENEMHAKHTGAIERLEQIAKATKNDELLKTVERLKEKEAKRHKLIAGE